MADPVRRRCSVCGKVVRGSEKAFQSPRKCPGCGKLAQFVAVDDPLPAQSSGSPDNPNARHQYDTPTAFKISANILMLNFIFFLVGTIVYLVSSLPLAVLAAVFSGLSFYGMWILRNRVDDLNKVKLNCKAELKRELDSLEASYIGKHDSLEAEYKGKYELLQLQHRELENAYKDKDESLHREQEALENKRAGVMKLGKRYMNDVSKWYVSRLTTDNYTATKEKILKAAEYCEEAGFPMGKDGRKEIEEDLKKAYEEYLRKEFQRQEQARIKEKIREEQREQREQRERDKEIEKYERERKAIEAALEHALRIARDEHSAEIESLRQRLKEAEERGGRAKAMAEMTRAGYVYVISNYGSFGTDVYKIGMTRRLEPMDRVRELGDASVPFPFDVHMMISCDDAPKLETALHKEFHAQRLNRVNLRKEFFRVPLDAIAHSVQKHHGTVEYQADPEALEWRQSSAMSEEDYEFITSTVEQFQGAYVEDE